MKINQSVVDKIINYTSLVANSGQVNTPLEVMGL